MLRFFSSLLDAGVAAGSLKSRLHASVGRGNAPTFPAKSEGATTGCAMPIPHIR